MNKADDSLSTEKRKLHLNHKYDNEGEIKIMKNTFEKSQYSKVFNIRDTVESKQFLLGLAW